MAQSHNQIYDNSNGKLTPAVTGNPPAVQYGAQGMRGRLYRMGMPSVKAGQTNLGIGRQSVQSAFQRIK